MRELSGNQILDLPDGPVKKFQLIRLAGKLKMNVELLKPLSCKEIIDEINAFTALR